MFEFAQWAHKGSQYLPSKTGAGKSGTLFASMAAFPCCSRMASYPQRCQPHSLALILPWLVSKCCSNPLHLHLMPPTEGFRLEEYILLLAGLSRLLHFAFIYNNRSHTLARQMACIVPSYLIATWNHFINEMRMRKVVSSSLYSSPWAEVSLDKPSWFQFYSWLVRYG